MQANDYQQRTIETAIYPESGTGSTLELAYLGLGLASEAGEVSGKIKKLLRDGRLNGEALVGEIGDVCWYVARLASALGVTLEDVLQMNYEKLQSRKVRGTLQGNGDNR